MRLWSVHPKYLDAKGLVALWRETLLAQQVLLGKTKAYANHPQLNRFKARNNPVDLIGFYLMQIYTEAVHRGYNFNKSKIIKTNIDIEKIPVNKGQLIYELKHLKNKLHQRDTKKLDSINTVTIPETNPLFYMVNGDIEDWEVI